MLCTHYKIQPKSGLLKKLSKLQEELLQVADQFSCQFLPTTARGNKYQTGMILQALLPFNLIDQIAYASLPFGVIDTSSTLPLSARCLKLCTDPHSANIPKEKCDMQMRLLIQSLFVPDHRIKVIAHGCCDFFSEKDPQRPISMSDKDWTKVQECNTRKKAIISEIRAVFMTMLMPSKK